MIEIRLLRPSDDRSKFNSGDADLDRFFHKYAGQNQFRHHIGNTWIAVLDERILGFATVSASHIEIENLPKTKRKKLPAYPLPVLRLARLAVSEDTRSMGIGKKLLKTVFQQARDMAGRFGCCGIVVDAKQEVVTFYKRLGFEIIEVTQGCLPDKPPRVPMFISLGQIP